MNSIRKVLGFLMAAVMLAAFALPAGAANPQKIYSMTVSPIGSTPVAVTITNETPNGNSTINSFVITPPPNATVSIHTPPPSVPATVTKSGGKIYVNGFNGLKVGTQPPKSLTIYLDVSYTGGAPTCGTGYTWTAVVYTGNSFGQETFDQVDPVTKQAVVPANSGVTQTAACDYSVTMAPGSRTAGTSTTLSATLNNLTPSGGPTITSATLTAPAGLTITGVTAPAGTTASFSAGSVTVSSTSVAPGGSLGLTINVNTACVPSSANWTPTASSASGAFSLKASASTLGTAVTGSCSMMFQTPPSNVVAGSAITPAVVVAINGAGGLPVPYFVGPVTLNTGGCGVGTVGSLNAVGGVATFPAVVLTTPGSTTLTACSSVGSASFSLTSASITVYGGVLACAGALDSTMMNPNGYPEFDPITGLPKSGWAGFGSRGLFNKDGSNCQLVNYTFTNNILTSNSVTLVWDTGAQPNAAFKYTMNWQPEWVDPVTGLPKASATKVQWFKRDGTLVGPFDGRSCLSNQLPTPYGTLTGFTTSPAKITIGSSGSVIPVPTTYPFPIFIGDGTVTERLSVTGLDSGNTYFVDRQQGGTAPANLALVVGTALVMSNPLPLDSSTPTPLQVQVCLTDEGFAAVSASLCTSTPPSSPPPACAVVTSTVFDLGDGGVIRAP